MSSGRVIALKGLWQGACRIMRHELLLTWRGYLLTFFYLAYGGFFTTLFLDGHLSGELSGRMIWALDLAYIGVIQLLGFLMDPTIFRYRKEDTYSRKLAEWQTLPIGVVHIIAGRLMLLITVLFVNCLLLFGFQYVFLPDLREMLAPTGFALYFLTWFGYGIAAGTTLVFMELGFPGRVYFNYCVVNVVVMILFAILLGWLDASVVFISIEAAADRDWRIAAASMAAAALAIGGFGALLHRRINQRSFWL